MAQSSTTRIASELVIIALLIVLVYYGQSVLVPLAFAGLTTVLLISPCKFFERQGFPRISAALICVLLGLLFFILSAHLILTQLIAFRKDLPLISQRLVSSLNDLQQWIVTKFDATPEAVAEYVNTTAEHIFGRTSMIVGTTFFTLSKVLFLVIIIPIYTFLLLIYRNLIVQFILGLFDAAHLPTVHEVLTKTRIVVRSYLAGLFIETIIVAMLHWIGFVILGVKYAILLAVLSAFLKLIPYLGIVAACVMSALITLTTNSPNVVIGLLIVLLVVHLIDGNIIFPIVVGAKVRMNALAIIVGVIVGSALWGIPGMFLAIPILAILKVIFDNVDRLQPVGLLLGEDPSLKRVKKAKKDKP
jgi:putative permease